MGKKVKKKSRAPIKEKRIATSSPKKVPEQSNPSVETVGDVASVVKERKPCVHLDKGVDLSNLEAKIGSPEPIACEDCRLDGKGNKGKGRHGKKKGATAVDSKAIWVCLECGHYACGGIGLPTTQQTHAVRHARQTRHPLVIHIEKPQLCWCYPCNTLIPVEKMEKSDEHKDVLSDVVKLIKGRSSEGSLVDVEDVWFGGGSVTSEIKAGNYVLTDSDGGGGYLVRGLVNLGNTCFFNSIMQNLLAMDRLRDYFFKLDESVGPLTAALKKLFIETKPEGGSKNVINPRSFFGSVCSKAPQFRGYQQHDSHELLRCLLDGLSTEESGARKKINSSKGDGISSNLGTFVDDVFGGQISSSVCCVECGHSSTVKEPFLDLSLPVPTKKPPSRKAQPVPRPKKTKLPPKRGGKTRPKASKGVDLLPVQSVSIPSASSDISSQAQSSMPVAENVVASSGDSTPLDSVQVSESAQVFENNIEQTSALMDEATWLDYLEPGTISDEHELTAQNNDVSVIQDPENKDIYLNDVSLQASSELSTQVCSLNTEPNPKPDSSSVNYWEDELPLQVQGTEILLLPYKEESSSTGEMMREEGEASSSVVGCGQDDLDFDGFGDMFNEPEIIVGPIARPSVGNEVAETGFMTGNSTESDPDEVDNTNSLVTVESCLAHFIKPELLSNENAWHCENCSKILQHQRLKAKKQLKPVSAILMNGGDIGSKNDALHLDKDFCPTEVGNLSNRNIKSDTSLNDNAESLVSHKENKDCSKFENDQTGELNPVVSQREDGKVEIIDALPEQSYSSGCNETCSQESFSGQAIDSCSAQGCSSTEYTTDEVQQSDSQLLDGTREAEGSEDEEMDSKTMKVKRDATKRVLIDKAPPILTIHLKRFIQDARGRLHKLNGHVNFRETIDLRPYMDPRCIDKEKYHYRLVGVVEHSGTMRGGHYIAYVRGGEKSRGKAGKENGGSVWYYVSDAYVREASLDEVLRCEAYVLFYEEI